jgi:hypothetical protein
MILWLINIFVINILDASKAGKVGTSLPRVSVDTLYVMLGLLILKTLWGFPAGQHPESSPSRPRALPDAREPGLARSLAEAPHRVAGPRLSCRASGRPGKTRP